MTNFYLLVFTEKLFSCQICHKSYSNKRSLIRHMKVHDETKALKCDVCLKLFSTKSELISHYRTHTGEKSFACQICDRKFAHKQTFYNKFYKKMVFLLCEFYNAF